MTASKGIYEMRKPKPELLNNMNDYLTVYEAAEVIGVSVSTIRNWYRWDREGRGNIGPDYFNIGRMIMYKKETIKDFLQLG